MTRIVVVGGGYAGTLCALRLARRARAEVTLIDPNPAFTERVRMHERSAGAAVADLPYAGLLAGSGARFVPTRATGLVGTRVLTDAGPIDADHVVLALGSVTDQGRVPGVAEHALSPGVTAEAAAIASRLPGLAARGGRVAVVGGGLTGLETVTEIASRWPTLRCTWLTAGAIGADLSPGLAARLRASLDRLRIVTVEHTTVAAVDGDGVWLEGGERLPFELVVWCGPFRAHPLLRAWGLPVGDDGRVVVDPTLRVGGRDEIYAIGDAAAPRVSGFVPRMSCAAAMPMGAHAADVITDRVAGRTPAPFRFAWFVRCVSVGRGDGLVQFVSPDDLPVAGFSGRPAAMFKELIVRYTVRSLRLERRGLGYRWPRGPLAPGLLERKEPAAA